MPDLLFGGKVSKGQFVPDDLAKYRGRLAQLEGKRVRVSVKRESTGRSLSQNRLLWGVLYHTLSEWSGHSPEELHEYLKDKFLAADQKELPSGEVMVVTPSTTMLTVEEFTKYVDEIYRWAAERGCYIPSPDEVTA